MRGSPHLPVELMLRAADDAIADAGLTVADIDGIVPPPGYTSSEELAANLGIDTLRFATTVHMGGASSAAALQHAALAVTSGLATQRARRRRLERLLRVPPAARACRARGAASTPAQSATSCSTTTCRTAHASAAQFYAWIATRHKQLYGTLDTDTGEVAVTFRAHAQHNEKALMRGKPLTMDDYLAARWVSEPFRLFDCCLETDCAAAVVVTSAEHARDLPQPPAVVLGMAEGHPYPADDIANRPDPFRIGLTDAAPRAFAMAGVEPRDMDFLAGVRLLHVRRAAAVRGARSLRTGRSRRVRARRSHRGRRRVPDEHARRAAVAGSHVGHEPRRRGRAPAAGRGRAPKCRCTNAEIGCVTGWGDFGDGSLLVLGADR